MYIRSLFVQAGYIKWFSENTIDFFILFYLIYLFLFIYLFFFIIIISSSNNVSCNIANTKFYFFFFFHFQDINTLSCAVGYQNKTDLEVQISA